MSQSCFLYVYGIDLSLDTIDGLKHDTKKELKKFLKYNNQVKSLYSAYGDDIVYLGVRVGLGVDYGDNQNWSEIQKQHEILVQASQPDSEQAVIFNQLYQDFMTDLENYDLPQDCGLKEWMVDKKPEILMIWYDS